MRKRLLVTGREGQVVSSLLERGARHKDLEIFCIGRPELDLEKPDMISAVIEAAKPDAVISAAAYTAVDQAEKEEDLATVINGEAAGALARAAKALGVPIIHLSTDYVFDGNKLSAYVETDPVSPVGAYGRSKLAGERLVAAATDNHVILRTAWVHSPFGKNFAKTMLRLAEGRDEINVVADQYGTPTSALDIADAVIAVTRNLMDRQDTDLRGVFHMTCGGRANWADFAEEIFRVSNSLGGPRAAVRRIPSSDYPTPAKRPANSQLDCTKLSKRHDIVMPDWKRSTRDVITLLLGPA